MKDSSIILQEFIFRNISSEVLKSLNTVASKFKCDISTILMIYELGFTDGLEEDMITFMEDYETEKRNILEKDK